MLEENHVVRDFEKENKFALIFITEFYDKAKMKDIPNVKNDLKKCKATCTSMGIPEANIRYYIDSSREKIATMKPEMAELIRKITQ